MKRLTKRFMRGGSKAYKSLGIDFEPRWFTVFYLIYTQDSPLSISEIASSLKISHPAVIQTTQMLIKKGLIKSFQDSQDRRIRRLAITEKGKKLVNFLIPFWNDFETATLELFEKAGVEMLDIILRTEAQLDEEDVGSRILNRIKQRQYNAIEILDYAAQHKEYFQRLNYEWLEKYFKVEELDKKILLNPEEEIIHMGPQKFKMIPLSETYFVLDGEPSVRVEFKFNDKSKEYEIIGHFPDGRKEVVKRVKD